MVQPPDAPPEVKEWAQNTVVGVLVGIIFGGGRQYLADRAAGATIRPPGTARASLRPRSGAHPLHGPDCSRPHGFFSPPIARDASYEYGNLDRERHQPEAPPSGPDLRQAWLSRVGAGPGSQHSALVVAGPCARRRRTGNVLMGIARRSLTYRSAARFRRHAPAPAKNSFVTIFVASAVIAYILILTTLVTEFVCAHGKGVPSAPAGLPSKAHAAKWVADVQTARLLAQMRAAVKCVQHSPCLYACKPEVLNSQSPCCRFWLFRSATLFPFIR